MTFNGFPDSESFTQLPDTFFQQLLPEIGDRAELKVTLFFLWQAQHMEGPNRALRQADFEEKALGLSADEIAYGLKKAVQRGTILKLRPARASDAGTGEPVERREREAEMVYILNSPRGRAAVEEFNQEGRKEEEKVHSAPAAMDRPNLFKLYEEFIGPLTPMIADMLKDAEQTYSQEWVAEALEIAVSKNIRNWKYVEAILKRWKEEHERKDRQNAGKGSARYTQSEFEEYLNRK